VCHAVERLPETLLGQTPVRAVLEVPRVAAGRGCRAAGPRIATRSQVEDGEPDACAHHPALGAARVSAVEWT
jgi:hypothetical protein